MPQQFIPGLGLVTVPEVEKKSIFHDEETVTLADKAAHGFQQGHATHVLQPTPDAAQVLQYVKAASAKGKQNPPDSEAGKDVEALTETDADTDVEEVDELSEDGSDTEDAEVEEVEEVDEADNKQDKKKPVKKEMPVEDKSLAIEELSTVFIPKSQIEAKVIAKSGDTLTVRTARGQLLDVLVTDVNPA